MKYAKENCRDLVGGMKVIFLEEPSNIIKSLRQVNLSLG